MGSCGGDKRRSRSGDEVDKKESKELLAEQEEGSEVASRGLQANGMVGAWSRRQAGRHVEGSCRDGSFSHH